MNRKNLVLALAALMVLSFSAAAFAGWGGGPGRGGCPGWGPGYNAQSAKALTPEQQEKLDVLRTEHLNKVEPLRKEALAKEFELRSLMVDAAANAAKVKALAKDLSQVQARLFQERVNFRLGLAELGIEGPWGMGPGFGPCAGLDDGPGRGHGRGPGMMHGRGMGPGYGQGMMNGYGQGMGPGYGPCGAPEAADETNG